MQYEIQTEKKTVMQRALYDAKVVGKVLALILALASAASYFISMVLGPVLFFSTSDGLSLAARHIHDLPIEIFMIIPIPIPLTISFGLLFMVIWAAFVICFLFAWWSRGGFIKSLHEVLTSSVTAAKTNFLFLMPLIASGLLVATELIQSFQETQGVQTGSLNFPPATNQYLILLNLAYAPLDEEFAFRITSIGIVIGIFLLIRYQHDAKLSGAKNRIKLLLLAMLSPERAKAKLGYKNVETNGFLHGISLLEWILILATGFAFGSAHYLLGGGWEIGKVSTAFLAGVAFGVAYVAYGAYADILLHWFFNYYFTILDMASSTFGGAFQGISTITVLTTFAAGSAVLVIFLLYSAAKLGVGLTKKVEGMGYSGS